MIVCNFVDSLVYLGMNSFAASGCIVTYSLLRTGVGDFVTITRAILFGALVDDVLVDSGGSTLSAIC